MPKCINELCNVSAVFNFKTETNGLYCNKHKLIDMVNIVSKKCKQTGCLLYPNYNYTSSKGGLYCVSHKLENMIDMTHKKCFNDSCTKRPIYNHPDQTKPLYCNEHKKIGMKNIVDKLCAFNGCNKINPCFNIFGAASGKYCSVHKEQNMVNISKKICNISGCIVTPTFSYINKKSELYCAEHKLPGMISNKLNKCGFNGCTVRPSFNISGEPAKYCKSHKSDNMINVIDNKCSSLNCPKVKPCFNFPGEKKGIYCGKHKIIGMINVTSITCKYENCSVQPRYGKPGFKPTKCSKHKDAGMIKKPTAKCKICKEKAVYGINFIPRHCENHKTIDDKNLIERNCASCNLLYVLDDTNKCENCNPLTFIKRKFYKQNELMKYLDNNGHYGTTGDDKIINNGECGRERPDRIIELIDKIIIIECDENQHKDRPNECEVSRMINISQSFGGTPVYFIRWNPDNYKTTTAPQACIKTRYKLICEFIKNIKSGLYILPTSSLVSVIYMYFDNWVDESNLSLNNWQLLLKYN